MRAGRHRYIDAIHDLFRNAFSVYGADRLEGSSVTFKMTEVSYPNGRVALRFQGQHKAPNGHAMSTIDTALSKGYDPTLFLGTQVNGAGAPSLSAAAIPASAASARLELGCVDGAGCRGTVALRESDEPGQRRAAAMARRGTRPARGLVLGRASYRITAGDTRTVRVKLASSARKQLRRRKAMKLTVELRAHTTMGMPTFRHTATLRATNA